MRQSARASDTNTRAVLQGTRLATPGGPARSAAPSPAQALALQRTVGNRAAARVLARWTKHPDETKKGVMVTDVVAQGLVHFNPPQNK